MLNLDRVTAGSTDWTASQNGDVKNRPYNSQVDYR